MPFRKPRSMPPLSAKLLSDSLTSPSEARWMLSRGAIHGRMAKAGLGIVAESDSAEVSRALEDIALATSERRKDYIAVPLREHVTVYITNLPLDLDRAEADRIACVVSALAIRDGKGGSDAG